MQQNDETIKRLVERLDSCAARQRNHDGEEFAKLTDAARVIEAMWAECQHWRDTSGEFHCNFWRTVFSDEDGRYTETNEPANRTDTLIKEIGADHA